MISILEGKLEMIKEIINDPSLIIRALNKLGLLRWIPDELYVKWRYKIAFNEKLNLKKPKTYNEKLQWLKLNNHNPKYVKLVDKLNVRNYISEKIGKSYLIPLVGVWDNVEQIDWQSLPSQFVLKCTHDSGSLVVCNDKEKLDIKSAKKKLKRALTRNYYYSGREWPYKFVEPKIIGEEFLIPENDEELKDYRFFCFNGKPKFISVDSNINDKTKTRRNLYDLEWNMLDAEITYPKSVNNKLKKPDKLAEMINICKKLSQGIPHVRIDLYYLRGKIYFGEFTFYHQGGLGEIRPENFSKKMGQWITLPEKTNNTKI